VSDVVKPRCAFIPVAPRRSMESVMTKLAAMVVGFFLALGLPAFADGAPMEIKGASSVNADGVIDLVQKHGDLVILDNRSPADFEAGHIEGAVRLIDTDITGEAVLAKHVKSKDTPVLFYCNGLKCGRAAKATMKAVEWGYGKVYYYALGLEEWKQRNLPLVR
jgi:rhodanese-related sulfurtransferase